MRKINLIPPFINGIGFGSIVLTLLAEWSRQSENIVLQYPKGAPTPHVSAVSPLIKISEHTFPQNTICVCFSEMSDPNADEPYAIFLTPTFQDIQYAMHRRGELLSSGIESNQIHFILLHENIPGGIDQSILTDELKEKFHPIPFDLSLLMRAELERVPLSKSNPQSHLTKRVCQLAGKLWQYKKSGPCKTAQINWEKIELEVKRKFWAYPNQQTIQIESFIDHEIHEALQEQPDQTVPQSELQKVKEKIINEMCGYGPLEQYLNDPLINEIMVNGLTPIYIETNGHTHQTEKKFINQNELRTVIDRMVSQAGRRIDTTSPLCNVRLPDGSRANIVLPPLSLGGPLITIRRFSKAHMALSALIKSGSVSQHHADFLSGAVVNRKNILIAGNTGSGKTTLLNALSEYIDPQERIITLEDAAELQLKQNHTVRLETRSKNIEGHGEINMHALVINAMRMRPDRIIVGEVRGKEAIPMIQAMNTGHRGSMSTIHASSATDAIKRLETLILLGAPQWPISVVRQLIGHGFQVIAFLTRLGSKRQLTNIIQLEFKNDEIQIQKV